MAASVDNPPSVSHAGAGACTTPSPHDRHAYLSRRVTSTRNCAGTMSSRPLLSSPIRYSSPLQQGHVLSSISTTISILGKCCGRPLGKQHCRQRPKVVSQDVVRHQQIGSYSPEFYNDLDRPDSLRTHTTKTA
ncbi:hypothetical protein ACVWZZ_004528 [Bradyrhizobium sp. LM6.10]